jgi:hypothetical protein
LYKLARRKFLRHCEQIEDQIDMVSVYRIRLAGWSANDNWGQPFCGVAIGRSNNPINST